jgi:hypothetical protein
MKTYNSTLNNYVQYEKIILPIDNKINECISDRDIIINNKKNSCNTDYKKKLNKLLELRFQNISKKNDCRKILTDNNIKNNYARNTNLYSNKHNKTLTPRIINTIPYRNYSNFTLNPELELYIKNGYYKSTSKSVNNTAEIKSKKYPQNNKIKTNINNKNTVIDLDRFQLSTRQLKGNKNYINNYKKKLKQISHIINLN